MVVGYNPLGRAKPALSLEAPKITIDSPRSDSPINISEVKNTQGPPPPPPPLPPPPPPPSEDGSRATEVLKTEGERLKREAERLRLANAKRREDERLRAASKALEEERRKMDEADRRAKAADERAKDAERIAREAREAARLARRNLKNQDSNTQGKDPPRTSPRKQGHNPQPPPRGLPKRVLSTLDSPRRTDNRGGSGSKSPKKRSGDKDRDRTEHGKRRRDDNYGKKTYAEASRGSRRPQWQETDIRIFHADARKTISLAEWKKLEPLILKAHGALILQLKRSLPVEDLGEAFTALALQRIYYDTDLNCGILEAKVDASAEAIRNKFIPGLALPIQIRASILADSHLPIVSVFTPGVYQAYEAEEYKELLQAFNPILLEHPFITHQVEPRPNGIVYYFQTTDPVVEYIKGKEYTLEYPLGQAIFHRRVEYETVDSCLSIMPAKPQVLDGDDLPHIPDIDTDPISPSFQDNTQGPSASGGPYADDRPVDRHARPFLPSPSGALPEHFMEDDGMGDNGPDPDQGAPEEEDAIYEENKKYWDEQAALIAQMSGACLTTQEGQGSQHT